ncbi:MAG: Uma2 family endonuclease [Methylacidiphilales bacterium]|nr:Uma2 family endonuclease [Candidatus Methylacidiphilales bacterium]NJR19635.1 Uma2 family endonuclease [Calothrix sp. CSU_2_0]
MTSPVLQKPSIPKESYVLLDNVSWEQLEQLDVNLSGTGARLIYLDGILEIMSPLSDDHEDSKSTLSLLLEAFMRAKKIRFYVRGSATLGKKENNTRREPDESYNLQTKKPIPDLVLEITVTSGGINKLEIYKRLGVAEVWFWEDGLLSVYVLDADEYQQVNQSHLLPDLDLELLAKYSRMSDQFDAVNEYTELISTEK